ncbi:MAG: response regulator transcription factor [Gammaproteobacteria bacterium]
MRILIIEDEQALREQLAEKLRQQHYIVDATGDGQEGLFFAQEYPLDAAIIDLGLPGISGIEIIEHLRQAGQTLPILILTARDRWQDKVNGLEAGGDDYLTKPFHFEELLARLKALLRRASGSPDNSLQAGPVTIQLDQQQVLLHDKPLELTTFEYRLLEHLVRHNGQVLSKNNLADYLYPHDEDRDSNVIEVMIGRLRKKLDPDGQLKPIETLRGRGYRFHCA